MTTSRLRVLKLEDRTTPTNIWYEGFDAVTPSALPSGWSAVNGIGPDVRWQTGEGGLTQRYAAHTRPNYAAVGQGSVQADKTLVSPVVGIPDVADVQLRFFQTYFFYTFGTEDYFNGGVLEISINGGAFTDILAAGGSFVSGGYNDTMSGESLGASYNNPLAGRQGWVGSTLGFANGLQWFETLVNLPDAARGQAVQFRWRMGVTDLSTFGNGWYVDSIGVGFGGNTFEYSGGGGQDIPVGSESSTPLRVRVVDRFGLPVRDVPVQFTAPSALGPTAELRPTSGLVRTDTDGVAAVTLRANGITGFYTVSASTPGLPTLQLGMRNVPNISYAVAAGVGGGPNVKVYDQENTLKFNFFAYDPGFRGGVVVATGDLTGDGIKDVVTGTETGAPHIKVFDGATGREIRSFFAFDPAFVGGVSVAIGDVTGNGVIDIVVGAGPGGAPHVVAFDGQNGQLVRSFFAFDPAFRGGVSVAVGNGELIVGAGPGGGPHVKVYGPSFDTPVASFFAFDPAFAGGVNVGAMSSLFISGEGILAGQKTGGSAVGLFNKQGTRVGTEQPFGGFTGGARVAGTSVTTATNSPVFVAAAGPNGGPRVRGRGPIFTDFTQTAATFNEVFDFFPFDTGFTGGVNVG
jgi:hypothetical protein